MRSTEIDNIKKFTAALFAGNVFDEFLAVEAVFSTACRFSIDGHLNDAFISDEELQYSEKPEGIIYWKRLKAVCYEIIKGKKVPSSFSIVFKMPESMTGQFLKSCEVAADPDSIAGLFLNVNFKQGRLYCTTGCSRKVFSMDKSLETAWDEYMAGFLKKF